MKNNHNLDLLRAVAVSIVVVQHTLITLHISRIGSWDIGKLGRVGVLMFFVHTSLVLMWSLERKPNPLDFYLRRAFRIYPVAVVAILATVLFHIPTMHNAEGFETEGLVFYSTPSIMNLIANLLLVQDFVWTGSILQVMWTLPLELAMYLLLPFLFFVSVGKSAFWRVIFLWGLVIALDCLASPSHLSFANCMPAFLAGVVAKVLFTRIRPCLPGMLLPVWLGVLLASFMVRPTMQSGWWLTIALGLTLPFFCSIRSQWLITVSHQIAKYSYGIYLLHLFCLLFGLVLLKNYNPMFAAIGFVGSLVVLVVPAYHLIEKPMIDLGARVAKHFFARKQVLRSPITMGLI